MAEADEKGAAARRRLAARVFGVASIVIRQSVDLSTRRR
jgi:hypothetical protein